MISSKKHVDETLKKYNLVANKALGQNFLVEHEIASYIVDNALISNETCVIEIGPGMGALTEFAIKKAKTVKVYEIDSNMVEILKDTFDCNNLEINNIDFLKVDIEKLIVDTKKEGYKDIVILSNLPYYITSKLLNKILVNNYDIKCMVAMMQKEVGQKIIKPEKKDYNLLSVILQYQYDVSVVKYVGKNSYLPRPEIDSIVLKFEKVNPRYNIDFKMLAKICEALFAYRRKTVSNNLKGLLKDSQMINDCLKKCNLNNNVRVEQLSISDIVNICNYISTNN